MLWVHFEHCQVRIEASPNLVSPFSDSSSVYCFSLSKFIILQPPIVTGSFVMSLGTLVWSFKPCWVPFLDKRDLLFLKTCLWLFLWFFLFLLEPILQKSTNQYGFQDLLDQLWIPRPGVHGLYLRNLQSFPCESGFLPVLRGHYPRLRCHSSAVIFF